MRTALQQRADERFRVRAAVERLGSSKRGATALFVAGVDAATGTTLFDHLWMRTGIWSRVPWRETDWRPIRPGDVIEFEARASVYWKGRHDEGRAMDWQMARPTKVTLIHDALGGPASRLTRSGLKSIPTCTRA
jgi:hypothetical protein